MRILRALPLRHLKVLPVGMLNGENLEGGPVYVDGSRPWRMAQGQWRARWTSLTVPTDSYGQAITWRINLLANPQASAETVTLNVRASGWGESQSLVVNTATFTVSGAAFQVPCPPGTHQKLEFFFERPALSCALPSWSRPHLLVYQSDSLAGVPRDWEVEVDDDLLHEEPAFFAASQPNPSGIVAGTDEIWQVQSGVYLDGRDALIDLRFTDFAHAAAEVDVLEALDAPELAHPPMLYPYQPMWFSVADSGSAEGFVNGGGSIPSV